METLIQALKAINDVIWGPGMLILLIGTGLYLTVGLRFYTFRNIFSAFSMLWKGRTSSAGDKGELTPFNALMTALAGTIGTGSIVGVATAILSGGPGALFWMWCTAMVGMATKFSEILLAVRYREVTPAGNFVGGAMYFIKNGLGKNYIWLATSFAVFGMIACFGIGAMVQANSISVNLAKTVHVPEWGTALGLLFFAGIVLVGGVKRVGAVAGKLVPFMAVIYIVMCLVIIFMNIDRVLPGDAPLPTREEAQELVLSIMAQLREEAGPLYADLLRYFLLEELDRGWKEHLRNMDFLRDGIGLRAYGQRDPVQEYRMESYDMFNDMVHFIREETVRRLYQARVERLPERRRTVNLDAAKAGLQGAENTNGQAKKGGAPTNKAMPGAPGRNQPCPCGSGKKYKHCCGAGK